MTGPFVIDASVFLNAFNPYEIGSETSKEVLSKLQSTSVPLVSPTLLLPEIAAAVSRVQSNPDLARQFASTISHLPNLILVPVDLILAQQSIDIAAQHHLRGSDAVYAAVAQRFACPLVTLDREQHDRVASLVKTYYPIELLAEL